MSLRLVLGALLSLLLADVSYGQRRQPPRYLTITDPAQAGPEYTLQGEYAGWLFVPSRGMEFTGLQVVSLGEGKFDAVQYRGGLPGNGWDRATKTKLSGELADGRVWLNGPGERMVVEDFFAVGIDNAGRELGRLNKIGRASRTMGLPPPPSATVLFNGSSTEHFQPGAKITPDGSLMAGVMTKMPVDAFRMHLEFRTPYMPTARDQSRGNSGVYIQRRYEVQILDSFGLDGAFNEAGALYRQTPPDINMAFPPLTWQTYDIWFTPPRFADDGKAKLANARLTVLHNGIPVHWHREIIAKTGGGQQEGPQPLPIQLQDHGNPVVFRNIWIIAGDHGSPPQPSAATFYDTIFYQSRGAWPSHQLCY